jgi:hypothetical protein
MLTFDVLCEDETWRSFRANTLEGLYALVRAHTGAWPVCVRSCH